MIGLVLNHLWQSTLFATGAWLLTLTLCNNGAQTRFWVWFAASIKFLIPFAGLTAIGDYLLTPSAPKISVPAFLLMRPAAQPFSISMSVLPSPAAFVVPHWDVTSLVLLLWVLGFSFIAARWARGQLQLRRLLRDAIEIPLHAPVKVKSVFSPQEPALVGIWRPIILLPHGIADRLSAEELDAIMAHELCHLRRHDNLLTAIHMFVEALFWFHPLVWWLGKRMIEERERACDESVLASGKAPQIYADSILKVCKLYLHSPLTCAAGVSGSDLKQRLEEIVENKIANRLSNAKKAFLAATALLAVGIPVALGAVQAPAAQSKDSGLLMMLQTVPQKSFYNGPAPNRVRFTLTDNEKDIPLALILSADTCNNEGMKSFQCHGDIAMSMPSGIATSDAVTVDMASHKLTLNSKVVMFSGTNRMNGTLLILDTTTGVIHMNGKDIKSGFPGLLSQPPGTSVEIHDKVLPDR